MSIIEFWSQASLEAAPFVHPEDLPLLRKHCSDWLERSSETFESFIASAGFGALSRNEWQRFHFGLLPAPYAGDLANADIFVLLLNPGFGAHDYHNEAQEAWKARIRDNIRQRLGGEEFPNYSIDPRFAWTGAFMWWERKLKAVAAKRAEECGRTYREALAELSQHIAAIELVPYHSPRGVPHFAKRLPSAMQARAYLRDVLARRAEEGEITIIATRQVALWGLAPSKNVIRYESGQAIGASLGPNSEGGKAILDRLRASVAPVRTI